MKLTPVRREFEREWRERIVKNILDLIILKLLDEKPRWGYELNIEIKDRFQVYLSAGTLYPLLHSLEDKGLVEGVWDAGKGKGRRTYRITEQGREFLDAGESMLSVAAANLRGAALKEEGSDAA
ncbi:MAG: PadR family transcriptional regulator [Candidatus Bathyarchaeia archaeon]